MPEAARDVAEQYVAYRSLLLWVAVRKFGIPEHDAEGVLQEVFLAYLQCEVAIGDVRAWLIAVTCNASRAHLRRLGRYEALPPDDALPQALDEIAAIEQRITVQKILRTLPERAREALRLKFLEQRTYAEVGGILGTTEGYAEQLVVKSLARLRRRFARGRR